MSVIEEKYDDYVKERIEEVKNGIEIFKATPDYGYSILNPEDGQ